MVGSILLTVLLVILTWCLDDHHSSFRTPPDTALQQGNGSIQNTPDQAYNLSIGPQDIEGLSKRRSELLAAVGTGTKAPNFSAALQPTGSRRRKLANIPHESKTGFDFPLNSRSHEHGPSLPNRPPHLPIASESVSGGQEYNIEQIDTAGAAITAAKQVRPSLPKQDGLSHRCSERRRLGSPNSVAAPRASAPSPNFWETTPGLRIGAGAKGTGMVTTRDSDGSSYPSSTAGNFPHPPTSLSFHGPWSSRSSPDPSAHDEDELFREDSIIGRWPRNSLSIALKDLIHKNPYQPSCTLNVQDHKLGNELPSKMLNVEPVIEEMKSREEGRQDDLDTAKQGPLQPQEKSPKRLWTGGKQFRGSYSGLGASEDTSSRSGLMTPEVSFGHSNCRGMKSKDDLLIPSHRDLQVPVVQPPATSYSNSSSSGDAPPRLSWTEPSESLREKARSRLSDVSL